MSARQMPSIVYGTAWKKEGTTELVYQAIKSGFRGIDTACQPKHYREDLVGRALARLFAEGIVSREELFIQTKFTSVDGQDLKQPLPYDKTQTIAEQVRQSFATSLQNLGLDYIDSVVLHSPLRTREETLTAYRTLEGFVSTGQVRILGISNCYDPKLFEWLIGEAKVPVSVVQNRWHQENKYDKYILDLCQRSGITYQSFWTLTGNPKLLHHPQLASLAEKSGLTLEQAVYRYCQVIGITPLCGTTNEAHMLEALAIEEKDEINLDTPEVRTLYRWMYLAEAPPRVKGKVAKPSGPEAGKGRKA